MHKAEGIKERRPFLVSLLYTRRMNALQHQYAVIIQSLSLLGKLDFFNIQSLSLSGIYALLQGGQRTSYIRVFFLIENFIMAEIVQPSDKIRLNFLLFIVFNNETDKPDQSTLRTCMVIFTSIIFKELLSFV